MKKKTRNLSNNRYDDNTHYIEKYKTITNSGIKNKMIKLDNLHKMTMINF